MIVIDPAPLDAALLRTAFGCFPSGVTAIGGLVDGVPRGMAASSFTSVSLDPPLVSVCMQLTSETWPILATLPRLGVSVLGAQHDAACRQLASRSADRFSGLDWDATDSGAVLLRGASAWLECSIHSIVPAGDHVVVLLETHAVRAEPDVAPLVFHASAFKQLIA